MSTERFWMIACAHLGEKRKYVLPLAEKSVHVLTKHAGHVRHGNPIETGIFVAEKELSGDSFTVASLAEVWYHK